MMTSHWIRTSQGLLLLALMAAVSSCGFHPRGSVTELTDPGSIFVDTSRDLTISADLRAALRDRAFTLAANRDEAEILLRVTSEEQKQRVVSLKSTGRISELELSHAVDLLVAESIDGQPPVYASDKVANRIEVRREYTYDETGVLGKENEARILRVEMRDELVRQIILRTIASLAPSS